MKKNVDISRQKDYAASTLMDVSQTCRAIGTIFLILDILAGFIVLAAFIGQEQAGWGFTLMMLILVPGIIGFVIFNTILTITFEAQANLLNNTYRTEKWLEKIARHLCCDEEEGKPTQSSINQKEVLQSKVCDETNDGGDKPLNETKKGMIPVRVFTNKNDNIVCPVCQKEQNESNFFCVQCGQIFINGQPNIPYWCARCGHEGPYEESCPECGSSSRFFNTK